MYNIRQKRGLRWVKLSWPVVRFEFCTPALDHYLDESFSDHRVLADCAVEAIVVPGQRLEGHKLGAAETTFA